jgi:hypothetical protein
MFRRLIRRFRRGGSMPSYRPDPNMHLVTLSPGWVELPPGSKDRYPAEIIARINQSHR